MFLYVLQEILLYFQLFLMFVISEVFVPTVCAGTGPGFGGIRNGVGNYCRYMSGRIISAA